ncbi:MAG: VOC family protein [Chloroflexi bacterium]|nr:VOC family protein [Chloroflexota bacterium]
MRLHHVAISVKDVESSLAFYRDTLGLTLFQDEVISGPDVDTALMETGAKVRMVLLADEVGNMIELLEWQTPPARERPAEHLKFTSTGLVEVCLMVSDLEAVERNLARNGFSFRTPVWRFGSDLDSYGGAEARIRYVVDPDGVHVELMQVIDTTK